MSQDWTEGFCNETTGFLFRHNCQRFASWRCKRCGKPVCDEHAKQVAEETLAPSGDAGDAAPVANPGEEVTVCVSCARPARTGTQVGRTTHYYDDDDYYYRSRTYYPGYGTHAWAAHHRRDQAGTGAGTGTPAHDPNDLTPADAESLSDEGVADFESDMGAS